MDPTTIGTLAPGLYFDELHGVIEDFNHKGSKVQITMSATNITFYHEHSRGIVGHKMARDEMGYRYLAVAKADDLNPNIRYVDFYEAAPGLPLVFQPMDPQKAPRYFPPLKIDFPDLLVDGSNLVVSVTDHAPQEAPRDSNVDGEVYEGVCRVKRTERSGPCGPLNLPYMRPGNTLTRGQACNIVVKVLEHFGMDFGPYDPNAQYFEDVLPGSDFHASTTKLVSTGAISGYACDPQQKPNP